MYLPQKVKMWTMGLQDGRHVTESVSGYSTFCPPETRIQLNM